MRLGSNKKQGIFFILIFVLLLQLLRRGSAFDLFGLLGIDFEILRMH